MSLLGAPGVRVAPPEPVRAITGVRRDVAAFCGVAPRGPAGVAVPVTGWDEYRYRFGGYEGPGRLPYAVAAFFAQGGERAWVARIVHDHDGGGRATGALGPLALASADEGTWGDRVRATLSFAAQPLPVLTATTGELVAAPGVDVPPGSLLRVRLAGDVRLLRFAGRIEDRPDPAGPGTRRHLLLDVPLPAASTDVELVTGTLTVTDADPLLPRTEILDGVSLHAAHPRWLAAVLAGESTLVAPAADWETTDPAALDPALPDLTTVLAGGRDRWDRIVPEDFWDPRWVPGDERPGTGIHCLAENDEVALLVAPDLYDPAPLDATADVTTPPSVAGPGFAVCVAVAPPPPPAEPAPPGLTGLALDPRVPADLNRIVAAQRELVRFADTRRDLTVLLDVPFGLPQRRILAWRTAFDSPYAAAYHPWLDVAAGDDARDMLVRVNPSAFAAGIIAARERRRGVAAGPGNEIAAGAVRVPSPVTAADHDQLHPAGVNVFRPDRDGIRLTAARTLARDPSLRQLSVARLMTVLRLSLERELDWAVFEPNGEDLWAEVRRLVADLLTRMYAAGAFAGATTREAFFVRCDRTTMTQNDLDGGRFVCLVGVAPAEPLEYLVLRLTRDRDDTVRAGPV
ncbi:phage tail sheath C-terminal domain-containing protein [Actinoplanes subglobosus]|uniref:Phage tail sheath C-terminal domain-containing protein n=1 Tax=Actinoplanes subglobosus TaxID=1547892 RepID=A0ABV8IP10_9ACTN